MIGLAITVAAFEHELAVEWDASRIQPDAGSAGGASAHRFTDGDLARSKHVDERIAIGARGAGHSRGDE